MSSHEILKARLLERMAATGTNPSRLSLAVGTRDVVRMILNGRSKSPRSETLSGLARELKCDVRYLLGETDDPGEAAPRAPRIDDPDMQLTTLPNGKARLQINTVVPFALALEILAKIEGAKE